MMITTTVAELAWEMIKQHCVGNWPPDDRECVRIIQEAIDADRNCTGLGPDIPDRPDTGRARLEEAVGRPVTDDEWEYFQNPQNGFPPGMLQEIFGGEK